MPSPPSCSGRSRATTRAFVSLAAIGFTSTVAQVVLTRELMATFYGNELLFGLVLALWMAWVAVGAWGVPRLRVQHAYTPDVIAAGLILLALAFPAQIALVRDARSLLHVTPGAFVEFRRMVLAITLILAPLCVLAGFLFTASARLAMRESQTAGQVYVWESIGAVIGGAAFSFAFIHWLDPFQVAFLTGALNLATATTLVLPRSATLPRRVVPILVLAISLVPGLPAGHLLNERTLHHQWPDMVFAGDSPYGRLVVQARHSQRIFFENGLLTFETQGTFPEEVVHFPLLAHPAPKSVLLIGGGVAGDLREILKHPIQQVTYVELDPLLIQAARTHLPPADAAVLNDPRVHIVLSDGRRYVKTAPQRFDVVILDLPEPATGSLNRFYTIEFFKEVRRILNPDGIFSLGLPSAENYWSPELARRNSSIYRTLHAVFPEIIVLPGEHNFFLASGQPLPTNPAVLIHRLHTRHVATRRVTPTYIEYILTTDRFAQMRKELESTSGVRLNRDLTPICYYYDLVLWLSFFHPNLRSLFENVTLFNLWWIAAALLPMILLGRLRTRWAILLVVSGTGLAEMVFEIMTLLAFQTRHGYAYAELSLIVMAFMGGLTLGAATSDRILTRWAPAAGGTMQPRARRVLIAVQVAVTLYSLGFLAIIHSPASALAFTFPLLALAAGHLTGMTFPLAVAFMREDASDAIGTLYGADLIGGCVGALLGAALLIPILGIPHTCIAMALVGLANMILLL
ncbi:MAG: fused MFS/spermidine synthase [Anaerolineae bacterium]|nr:fused MFS/spermidine synthase [Anaerolineae bacterium]